MNPRGVGRVAAVALCAVVGLGVGVLPAVPAGAGVRYTALTRDSSGDESTMLVESEGAAICIEFSKGGGAFGKGDYLISEDGGTTV